MSKEANEIRENGRTIFDGKKFLLRVAGVELPSGTTSIWECPDGYIFKDENGNVINTTKIVLEKKKKEYPKTYKECCKVLGVDPDNYLSIRNLYYDDGYAETTNYEQDLLGIFDSLWELRICRDAYWKIAGEEMGLGKPWAPDFDNLSTNLEYIKIVKGCFTYSSRAFAFPTPEMQDAFYENFKELIESCKELL